jgi:hypothetical protein
MCVYASTRKNGARVRTFGERWPSVAALRKELLFVVSAGGRQMFTEIYLCVLPLRAQARHHCD